MNLLADARRRELNGKQLAGTITDEERVELNHLDGLLIASNDIKNTKRMNEMHAIGNRGNRGIWHR